MHKALSLNPALHKPGLVEEVKAGGLGLGMLDYATYGPVTKTKQNKVFKTQSWRHGSAVKSTGSDKDPV